MEPASKNIEPSEEEEVEKKMPVRAVELPTCSTSTEPQPAQHLTNNKNTVYICPFNSYVRNLTAETKAHLYDPSETAEETKLEGKANGKILRVKFDGAESYIIYKISDVNGEEFDWLVVECPDRIEESLAIVQSIRDLNITYVNLEFLFERDSGAVSVKDWIHPNLGVISVVGWPHLETVTALIDDFCESPPPGPELLLDLYTTDAKMLQLIFHQRTRNVCSAVGKPLRTGGFELNAGRLAPCRSCQRSGGKRFKMKSGTSIIFEYCENKFSVKPSSCK